MHVSVKVTAGSKKEAVAEAAPGRLEISVREEANRNMANKRVVALVASHFGVRQKQVRIVKGHRSASKLLLVSTSS